MLFRFFIQRTPLTLIALFSLTLLLFVANSSAQEGNICRDLDAPVITFDEELVGFLDPNIPQTFFCFDAERGTDVTVTVTPLSQNLRTRFYITTPFIDDSTGLFVDEPLTLVESPQNGGSYSDTVSITSDGTYLITIEGLQNVQGAFEISIEASQGNVLGGGETLDNDDTDTDDSTDSEDEDDDDDEDVTPRIVFGETDLCTVSTPLAYDDVVENTATYREFEFYCFEAAANDIVIIDLSTTDDLPLGYSVVDPFFDGTPNSSVFAEGYIQPGQETLSDQFLIEESGEYVLVVVALMEDSSVDYTLTISATSANVYNCENEPLATLSSRQWGIEVDGTPIIEINISCSQFLAIAALGGATVSQYEVAQDDTFVFLYQNNLYYTESLSEDEWVIEREDGLEFILEPLSDEDACSDEDLQTLIHGSWFLRLSSSQGIIFDFTCNGIVLIDDRQNPQIVGAYSYEDDTITITIVDQIIPLEDLEISEELIQATLDGREIALENILIEEEDD